MYVKQDERLDDLQRNGLQIIQNPKRFCFGMDAVLLANFTTLRKRDYVVDFGTGTGILPILLSAKEETATFTALEWQSDMAEMATRSVALNKLNKRIFIENIDFRQASKVLTQKAVDVVVCNPPYGKQGSTILNDKTSVTLARHETDCSLAETLQSASKILRFHGRIYLVFPATRLLELTDLMRKYNLEPKQIRFVCSKISKAPYLILVEGLKGGKPSLKWLSPLVVYNEDGSETEELKLIYNGGESSGV